MYTDHTKLRLNSLALIMDVDNIVTDDLRKGTVELPYGVMKIYGGLMWVESRKLAMMNSPLFILFIDSND